MMKAEEVHADSSKAIGRQVQCGLRHPGATFDVMSAAGGQLLACRVSDGKEFAFDAGDVTIVGDRHDRAPATAFGTDDLRRALRAADRELVEMKRERDAALKRAEAAEKLGNGGGEKLAAAEERAEKAEAELAAAKKGGGSKK